MISDNELSFKIINASCIEIAENKTNREVNELLVEELSELIKAVIKLQRWDNGETTLRYNIDEIHNNLSTSIYDLLSAISLQAIFIILLLKSILTIFLSSIIYYTYHFHNN